MNCNNVFTASRRVVFSSRTPSAPWGSPPAASCSGCCSQRRLELHGSTVSSPAWTLGMKIEKKAQSQIYTNIRQVSTDSPAFSFKSEVGWTMLNVFEQRRIETLTLQHFTGKIHAGKRLHLSFPRKRSDSRAFCQSSIFGVFLCEVSRENWRCCVSWQQIRGV